MTVEIERVETSAGFCLGAIGPVAVSIWDAAPTIAHAEGSVALLRRLSREHDGIALLAILGDGCALPDDRVRGVIAGGVANVAGNIIGVANVVEGQGFRAAALRGVLTSLALVMSPRYPQKVFADVATAAAFLEGHARTLLRARDVVRGVSELRAGEAS